MHDALNFHSVPHIAKLGTVAAKRVMKGDVVEVDLLEQNLWLSGPRPNSEEDRNCRRAIEGREYGVDGQLEHVELLEKILRESREVGSAAFTGVQGG